MLQIVSDFGGGAVLELAMRAAREAGQVLMEHFRRPHQIYVKGLRDISTEADLAAEKAVLQVISEGCPGARIVSEESHTQWEESAEVPTWYVDPLDGTTNFARGLSGFCVSVAMALGHRVQLGVVYDPLLGHLFHAERAGGAYLNGAPLHVSERLTLMDALVLLDWPRDERPRLAAAHTLLRLACHVDAIRSRGSAALGICSVAAGWADLYFQITLKPWDVAAGILLVEEAGGAVSDLRGQPYSLFQDDWLISNGLLHQAALALMPDDSSA